MSVWHIAAFTHRGHVRAANEDAISINGHLLPLEMRQPYAATMRPSDCYLMIADGLGGHGHGATASHAALEFLGRDSSKLFTTSKCREAISDANSHLYALMEQRPETAGMGTTLVGLALTPSQFLTFNVGDSRAYLNTRDQLIQLSHDDVPRKDTIAISKGHSGSITQALGGSQFVVPIDPNITIEPPILERETLLLCSDGITDCLSDDLIREVLNKNADIQVAIKELANQALKAGGPDNLSLVALRPTTEGKER